MPSIKKIKVIASPNIPKEKVKDMLGDGLHLLHRFEDEMGSHPFGHKLISIGKPMMMGGLHNVMDMMGGDTIPHLMHHLNHHPEHHFGCQHHHGPECCKDFVNNICKCIILFFIWKIFESIDCKCHGLSETQVLRKFRKDLQEQYGKITKVNSLLNESTLVLNEDHITAMKVNSLVMLSEDFNNIKTFAQNQWNGVGGASGIVYSASRAMPSDINSFIVDSLMKGGNPTSIATGLVAKAGWEIIKGTPAYDQVMQAINAAKQAAQEKAMSMVNSAKQSMSNMATDVNNAVQNTVHQGKPGYVPQYR